MQPDRPVALGLTLVFAIVFPSAGSAESPMPLDTNFLRQFSQTRGYTLGRPQKPKVTPDGKTVLFLRAEATTPKLKLYELTLASGETRELLSPESILKGADENLTPEEKARRERQRVSVGGFTDFHPSPDGTKILVKLSNKLYVLDRASGKVTTLATEAKGAIVDPQWAPDGSRVAYVRGHDVHVYDLAAGKESAVTTGGTETKTHGLAEFVAQEEMHRHSGFWWAPDSTQIAFEEADHTGVEIWHVADPFRPEVAPSTQYYPRPGRANVKVRVGIAPVAGGSATWIDMPSSYEYLARVQWEKYGPLTLMFQTRDQRRMEIQAVQGHASPIAVIEAAEVPWINLERVLLRWMKDGTAVIACGGARFREASATRHVVREISPGFIDVDKFISLEPGTGAGLFQGSVHPHQMHVFRVLPGRRDGMIRKEDVVPLTEGKGVHTVAGNDRVPIVTSSMATTMAVTRVVDPSGKPLHELKSVALEPRFVPSVQFVPDPPAAILEDRRSPILEKDDCFTGIVRPRDFDRKKRYPVIVSVYGGPTSRVVSQAMAPWLVRQWLADQGFIVVAIDNRGTTGRGSSWEAAVYQNFGTVPLDDQVRGLEAAAKQFPEIDGTRAGMVGWSFGGYMAANAVLRRPDVFKAAVAGAPVTDWLDYDTHYTERYLGLLPASKAAYDDASLLGVAGKLSRPLLLVHGTADDNVYYRHTLKLADALFRADREFDTLPLPGVTHMYSSDPVVMERLWTRTVAFFKTHLGMPR